MPTEKTLEEFFEHRIARFAAKPAFTCLGHTLSYGEIDRLASVFADYLYYELQMEPGNKLAIMLPNLLQYPVVVLGAIKAGVIIVNTNPLYTARELRHQLNDAEVKTILVLKGVSATLASVIAETPVKHVIITQVGDLHPGLKRFVINTVVNFKNRAIPAIRDAVYFRDIITKKLNRTLPKPLTVYDSLALLQYTGGTTGVSKGAMLTHANLLSNLFQVREVFADSLKDGGEIIVAPLPIYHIFAFMLCMLLGFEIGARVILIPDPRKTRDFSKALKGVRFTFFAGLNTLFNALCRNQDFRALDFSGLKLTISGGMALIKDTAENWEALTGCKVVEGYGLTETSPVVALNPPPAPKLGTVGRLLPRTQCRLVNGAGEQVGKGEPGELLVRGPQVMKGYWKRPQATDDVLDSAGWLHTGDVAVIDDDGYLSIVDRIKDMIVVSGFNVYPNEIESVISKHPDVVECAAVGVPDSDTVEAVKLFVVSANSALTEADIKKFARENLTGYKIPSQIAFIDELPKSNVGKVLRKELKGR